MKPGPATANSPAKPDEDAFRRPVPEEQANTGDTGGDPAEASVQDWFEADRSRPTLPEETTDGLDDTDEEVRHQAEDMPLDTAGRLR